MKFSLDISARVRRVYGGRNEPDRVHRLAQWYWRALLVLWFFVVAGMIAYGELDLTAILEGLAAPPSMNLPPPPALSRTAIDAAVQGFDARKTQFETLSAHPGKALADPSQ